MSWGLADLRSACKNKKAVNCLPNGYGMESNTACSLDNDSSYGQNNPTSDDDDRKFSMSEAKDKIDSTSDSRMSVPKTTSGSAIIDIIIDKLKLCQLLTQKQFEPAEFKESVSETKDIVTTTSVDVSFTKNVTKPEETTSAHLTVHPRRNSCEIDTAQDQQKAFNQQEQQPNSSSSFKHIETDNMEGQLTFDSEQLKMMRQPCKFRAIFNNDFINCPSTNCTVDADKVAPSQVQIVQYETETQLSDIVRLITRDLSEPYSIYTYRYFIHNWPHLCFLAKSVEICVGAIVCKLALHGRSTRRGYIAMLAVDENYRRLKIGTKLVTQAIEAMVMDGCDEVVLETEITNKSAMKLYENLGFVRDKRLFRYYLNGVDAFRLKLWLRSPEFLQYL